MGVGNHNGGNWEWEGDRASPYTSHSLSPTSRLLGFPIPRSQFPAPPKKRPAVNYPAGRVTGRPPQVALSPLYNAVREPSALQREQRLPSSMGDA